MTVKLLDVVALRRPYEEDRLGEGCVGTVVEVLDDSHFEVEFCDDEGESYACVSVCGDDLMVLRYSPVAA